MRLISKYNRTTLLATIIVLMVSGICYYFLIRYVLIHQLDKYLKVEEQEIIEYITTNNSLPKPTKTTDQWEEFVLASGNIQRKFNSYSRLDKHEHDFDLRRQLVFPVIVNGIWYHASVSKSQIETEDSLKLTFGITLGILLLLFSRFSS